jgi:predicted  nucleic acid-binding Zn-ribbon protein
MRGWKDIFMANETDPPGGVSEEESQKSGQSSAEITLGSEQSQHLSEEGYAPPWLRMDPELSRTVLSKTEEELLGALSALMRNKIEHEKVQRALANTVLEIERARQEVAGVKRQVAAAEDELTTRLAEQDRVADEIERARAELQAERSQYLEFQDELIAIKKEIDQARTEKAAAAEVLAELQAGQRTVRGEIESLQSQVAGLHDERHSVLQQVEPIRRELDERLVVREELIEQIKTMERHVAELTSTRDIRMNAQRIALVGRGTESMRDEIQQLKTEIERIEKERVRLATERDRVESEFAGLQSRLNLARSSYTETLERLDEARAALAVTEKEHDEAVSKLQYIHEPETKPLEVRGEPAEQQQTPEEVIVNQADTLGQEGAAKEPAQELVVSEQRGEAVLGDLVQQPALDKPEHEPELKEPTQEPLLNEPAPEPVAKEPEPEPALLLLTNEPLPAVIPTWDPYRLESEFFTEETLDAHRVAHLVLQLPGIENVLIVRQRGAVLAGSLPERLSDHLKTPDRDYGHLFSTWPNTTQERKDASAQTVTFQVGDEFLTVTQANTIFLIVSHERPRLHPGVEEKLVVVAEELDKMYPKAESGILGRAKT